MHNMLCLDCEKLSRPLDVISWDSYPRWHCGPDKTSEWDNALGAAFTFDYSRSLKRQPFYLMESAPGVPSQFQFCKQKRPGMHVLSSLLPIACGSESVLYFQWRMGNGGSESFHAAVIDHSGSPNTRIFSEVKQVGEKLAELSSLQGTPVDSQVALIYDYDNMQALLENRRIRKDRHFYEELPLDHYHALLRNNVNVDVISPLADFSPYRVIIAPALTLFRPDTAARIRSFVKAGGSFVLTYGSGLVNENDLCFSGTLSNPEYPPHDLNDVFGIRVREADGLCDDEENHILFEGKSYPATICCEIPETLSPETEIKAVYQDDFYAGSCSVSAHSFGKGRAWYLACHTSREFLQTLYARVLQEAGVNPLIPVGQGEDVMVRSRGERIFLMNFGTKEQTVAARGRSYTLPAYGYQIL